MSYSANQYNYATPLSSAASFNSDASAVTDRKYFTLANNTLDGSYVVASEDVGLWGTTAADANGNLSTPFVVTVTKSATIRTFRLVGSAYNYPVSFTVKFFNGSTLLRTITETNNTSAGYVYHMSAPLTVTYYEVSITKISSSNNVAQLFNTFDPASGNHTDAIRIKATEASTRAEQLSFKSTDSLYVTETDGTVSLTVEVTGVDTLQTKASENDTILSTIKVSDIAATKTSEATSIRNTIDVVTDRLIVKQLNGSHILNTIDVTKDSLRTKFIERESYVHNTIDVTRDRLLAKLFGESTPTNIHTVMKAPSRRTYGKVEITYVDPMLDSAVIIDATSEAYNSSTDQLFDGIYASEYKYFTLYDNDLSGNYVVSNKYSQVGWVSAELSDANGVFEEPVGLSIDFYSRPIVSFRVVFDNSRDNLVKDFKLIFTKADGSTTEFAYVDNTSVILDAEVNIPDVVKVQLLISRIARPNAPVVVYSIPLLSNILYKGYDDESDIISIDLFEELSYEDDLEMLGGVSANEITVTLDNSNRDFFFNSGSLVANQLKRNRKIVPWLGAEIIPGEIEWYTLGTFWSYKWDVPVNGLTATVVGFDTIGLLGNTPFTNHQTQVYKSIGFLLEYILEDAKEQLSFLEYNIDESLYDIVIPYAWFENTNHAAAMRKLSLCYPMHIYCDRQGRVCAAPQKLHLDYYYDIWSGTTNVIDTQYSSLYTASPNIINVTVHNPVVLQNEKIAENSTPFTVADMNSSMLNFTKPYLSDIIVDIDCDSTVNYTYEAYSWGIVINFTGSGTIRSILCTGSCVDTSASSVITRQDTERMRLDGAISRDVDSPFIQTISLVNTLLSRFFELLETDKYDATVEYRGDIALSINDPIVLQESIAPDNRYNIKRHQLSWNGALTGSADLNT